MDERAPRKRPAKKTGTIEFRVATEDKTAFLDACEQEGRPASGVLREAMAHFVRNRRIAPSRWSRLMPNSALAASLALVFAVQSADRLPGADRPYAIAEFDYYDLNSDGRLTLHEYLRALNSVRAIADGEDVPNRAGRMGSVFGLFVGHNGGPADVMFRHPELISEECWRAVEDRHLIANTQRFNLWDADNDSVVTPGEFGAVMLRMTRGAFDAAFDSNGDGVITQEDLDLSAQSLANFREGEPEREQQALDPSTFNEDTPDHVRICAPEFVTVARANPRPDSQNVWANRTRHDEQMFEHLDLDGDGVITFTEYATVMERNWTRR
ncbi:MAG: EF-hand domain-containing protein [Caulobacterales bacterium]|uniref:EF-hand domain-containing protein n=1 Tax=Glycocaulis sp. TaxID=1969725 RepID=UPI003F9ECFA8